MMGGGSTSPGGLGCGSVGGCWASAGPGERVRKRKTGEKVRRTKNGTRVRQRLSRDLRKALNRQDAKDAKNAGINRSVVRLVGGSVVPLEGISNQRSVKSCQLPAASYPGELGPPIHLRPTVGTRDQNKLWGTTRMSPGLRGTSLPASGFRIRSLKSIGIINRLPPSSRMRLARPLPAN